MTRWIRHTLGSAGLGLLAAGPLSALVTVALPAAWRGPGVVATVLAATVAGVVLARGIRPPAR